MNKKLCNSKITFVIYFLFSTLLWSGCNKKTPVDTQPFTIENAQKFTTPFHPVVSPNGNKIVYSRGDSLYVVNLNSDDRPIGISDGLRSQSSYATPYVAWSPNEDRFLYRAGDNKLMIANLQDLSVEQLLPDSLSSNIQTFTNFMAGGPSWSPNDQNIALLAQLPNQNGNGLQVYNYNTETKQLDAWTDEDSGVFSVAWSPSGRWLAYSVGSFSGDSGAIYLLDSKSDSFDKISVIEGESAAYRDLLWSADGQKLYSRNRGGEPVLFKINNDGKTEKLSSSLPSINYTAWINNNESLLTSIANGMSSRLAKVHIKTGETTFLTGADTFSRAVGAVKVNDSDLVVYTTESGNMPLKIFAAKIQNNGNKLESQRSLNTQPAILDSLQLAHYQIFEWQSESGDTLESQLFLPDQLDTKPPLIIIPYGAYSNQFPNTDYFLQQGIQVLASQGYAVVLPNTRGIASSSQTNNDYGAPQLSDTHTLLEALNNAGLADTSRVALIGHSHGGAMVYYYITHSSRFAAAIAINGAADWVEQAKLRRMSGLPFGMGGMPEEFPEKYEAYSPLNNADKVQTPLLAFAGRSDTQIPPFNAERMIDTLQSLGKDASLYIFEDEGHLIQKTENQRIFWDKVFDFLTRTVKN